MIKKLFSSEFGRGAIILFVTINLANFLNFLFHFLMGRMLGPTDYGTLAVLISFIYIYNVPSEAIQNIISKYVSKFNFNKEDNKIIFLMKKSLKRGVFAGSVLFLISIPISFFVSGFLKINFWLIVLTNLFIILAVSGPTIRGVLQGRKKFKYLGYSIISESVLKLAFSILFVFIGFKVFGAITGCLIGGLFGIAFSIMFNRDILKNKEEKAEINNIYKESIPFFVSMLIIFLALSLDIIFAKRFFDSETVGKYAVLSMLGKIIFFGTMAIGKVMFPLSSERYENGENSEKVFRKALFMVLALCIIAIFFYYFIPEFIIGLLYGKEYLEMSKYLVYSGISLSFLSLSNLILLHGLSINKLKKSYLLFLFLIIEVTLLYSFHNNIFEYTIAFMISNIIMCIGGIIIVKK